MPRVKSPPRPVTVEWVVRPGDRPHLCGAVFIDERPYFCEPLYRDPFAAELILEGYRLTALDTGKIHDVGLKYLQCDCPDALYRQRECKHMVCVKEILG